MDLLGLISKVRRTHSAVFLGNGKLETRTRSNLQTEYFYSFRKHMFQNNGMLPRASMTRLHASRPSRYIPREEEYRVEEGMGCEIMLLMR